MTPSKQQSFRRILLLRVILVSLPVVLIGSAVAFRQARNTLLASAHKNLSESADNKADAIEKSVEALQTSLVAAGESYALRTGDVEVAQRFLEKLDPKMPFNTHCLQIVDWKTGNPLAMAGECNVPFVEGNSTQTQAVLSKYEWQEDRIEDSTDPFYIHALEVQTQLPPGTQQDGRSQLNLAMSIPVYSQNGQLRYILLAQGDIRQSDSGARRSWLGHTVVLDKEGTILAHPHQQHVGKNVAASADVSYFSKIVAKALDGDDQDVVPLFPKDGSGKQLATFSSARVSISPTQDEEWIVLAVAELNTALYGLTNIKGIVLLLTGGLTIAHLIAMAYMARDLARPLEQLGEYANRIHDPHSSQTLSKNFHVREVNQLSSVLDNMVKRLEDRAKELETAWHQAQAASKAKDRLLATVSHELRTPLNAIINCVSFVKDDLCDGPEEEQDFLEKSDKAANDLLTIINDILDVAKIESGTFKLSMQDVVINEAIKEITDLQKVEALKKGLFLEVSLGPSLVVQADPDRLKQVLRNVMGNSIKFTEQGGITVETTVQDKPYSCVDSQSVKVSWTSALSDMADDTQSWVVVTVRDTGIGIDPALLPYICDPFRMVDDSTTRRHGGVGLGLAISLNLIRCMHGQITICSEGQGKGTSLIISLPILKILEPAQPSTTDGGSLERMSSTNDGVDDVRVPVLTSVIH